MEPGFSGAWGLHQFMLVTWMDDAWDTSPLEAEQTSDFFSFQETDLETITSGTTQWWEDKKASARKGPPSLCILPPAAALSFTCDKPILWLYTLWVVSPFSNGVLKAIHASLTHQQVMGKP